MGSVQSSCECPHCKGQAFEDYHYKTGEVYVMCGLCGYYESHVIDWEKKEKDGIPYSALTDAYWIHEKLIPVASLCQSTKGGVSCISTIKSGTVEEFIEELRKHRDITLEDEHYSGLTLSWHKDGKYFIYDLTKDTIEELFPQDEPEYDGAGFTGADEFNGHINQ